MAGIFQTPTFKALSILLTYPTEALVAAVPELAAVVTSDKLMEPAVRRRLIPLLVELGTHELYALQERYVDLFDRTRKLSLHLFEHVHGESRDRGQAMIDLARHYENAGLLLDAQELPDYLPLFLEYLASRPLDEARALLAETQAILAGLEERLARRGTPYAAVFAALLSIVGAPCGAPMPDEAEEADDLAVLDAAWEEAVVTFGPGEDLAGCSIDRLRTQLRAGKRRAGVPAV